MSFWKTLAALISDSTVRNVRADSSTHSLQTIDYAHHEVHGGSHFCVYINKDMPNGGTFNVAFTTPNTTKWLHMLIAVNVEVEADVILYEGITSWTGGTGITPLNNNRNSATASGVADMAYDVTATVGSPTQIAQAVVGSGKAIGGGSRNDEELVLKQNTKYYLVVTNQASGATNETNIALTWYEHTDKG